MNDANRLAYPLDGRLALVVESNTSSRSWTQEFLQEHGATVRRAFTPQEAREFLELEDLAFDLVVADYDLSSTSTGLDVIAAARKYYDGFVSTLLVSESEKAQAVAEAAGVPFFEKPLNKMRLLATIQVLIHRVDLSLT